MTGDVYLEISSLYDSILSARKIEEKTQKLKISHIAAKIR